MRAIWSELHKRLLMRRFWVALAMAQQEAGLVSAEQVADLVAHQNDIDLERAAQISRVLASPPNVTTDAGRDVAVSVLAHRMILVPELEGDTRARASIIEEALAKVGHRRAVRPV